MVYCVQRIQLINYSTGARKDNAHTIAKRANARSENFANYNIRCGGEAACACEFDGCGTRLITEWR